MNVNRKWQIPFVTVLYEWSEWSLFFMIAILVGLVLKYVKKQGSRFPLQPKTDWTKYGWAWSVPIWALTWQNQGWTRLIKYCILVGWHLIFNFEIWIFFFFFCLFVPWTPGNPQELKYESSMSWCLNSVHLEEMTKMQKTPAVWKHHLHGESKTVTLSWRLEPNISFSFLATAHFLKSWISSSHLIWKECR